MSAESSNSPAQVTRWVHVPAARYSTYWAVMDTATGTLYRDPGERLHSVWMVPSRRRARRMARVLNRFPGAAGVV